METFKIDTGYNKEYSQSRDENCHECYSRNQISVLGEFTATLATKDKEMKETVYVVKDLLCPLIGCPASLNLVLKVN